MNCKHHQKSHNHRHKNNNNFNDVTTMQYVNLLLDKQDFMLHKINNFDSMLNKTVKQNTILKEHIEILEDRVKMLVDQLDSIYGENECDHTEKNMSKKSVGTNEYDDSYNDNDQKHESNIIIKIDEKPEKHEKNKKEHAFNPIELLLGQLGGMQKQKEIVPEVDSDDEYDNTQPIYEEVENLDTEENFVELSKTISNINDLIELGSQFEEQLKNSRMTEVVKKDKHGKKKDKKIKLLDLQNNETTLKSNELSITNNVTNNSIYELYELNGKKYGINLETVIKLGPALKKLSHMIGMKKVKDDVFEMIIYYLQGFEKNNKNMLHSVIEGPPGVGKTKLGKILAQIYCALGIIPSCKFKYVKATDLIGDHVGATKHMTQEAIDDADGGVLFIDEAYALSSNDNKDPYGKECLDTLNFNLSENKKKLIVIIAGYPDYLDKYFFSFNPGLQRRFPFKFRIDNYTAEELRDIFIDKLKRFKWKFNKSIQMESITEFFKKNKDSFPNFGGDIENLFKSCQFAHSKRIIGKHPRVRGKLTFDDILTGFDKFKKNKREDTSKPTYPHMYT